MIAGVACADRQTFFAFQFLPCGSRAGDVQKNSGEGAAAAVIFAVLRRESWRSTSRGKAFHGRE